jgi:ABC-2 type transport system ATP-binding protein
MQLEIDALKEAAAATGSAQSELVVSVRGLVKRYGSREAVAGIDLEVRRGEIFAFLGPNGAGKTTTVEILEGFRQRTEGQISVLGHDPATAGGAWRDRVGVVLQELEPEPGLSVRECLAMYAGFYRAARDIDETIALVGLTGQADKLGTRLSGGQRRRLDFALALIGDPELIFLDEPTTGFDPSARRAAWEVVAGLRQLGKTVFLTTHYMDEAEYLADRIAVLSAGRIVAEGTPLLGIGWAAYGAHVPGRTALALAVTVVIGAASFCCLGYALTSLIRNEDAALPTTTAITLPLYFISGVFVAVTVLPHWLADVGEIFPVRHLANALLVAYNPHTTGLGFRRPGRADRGGLGSRGPPHRSPQVQLAAARTLTRTATHRHRRKTMAKEVQTQAGRCSTHGTVEATREVPKTGFPFVAYAIWRAVAQRRPFLCPECGAAVQAD